jgi:prepilin-type N-terminal cleavage/methylation domain-containing protein
MRANHSRAGFTQVELLTVLAILGLLAALIIPAIQAAREAGRRTDCQSHLRNLGTAIHAYESANGRWPPNNFGPRRPGAHSPGDFYSTHVLLLPYIGQAPLANEIDLSEPNESSRRRDKLSEPLQTIVPLFLCPSDRVDFGSNYRVCTGSGISMWGRPEFLLGAFSDRPGQRAHLLDGLSNTAAMSERIKSDEDFGTYDPQEDYWFTGVSSLPGGPSISGDDLIPICEAIDPAPSEYDPYVGHTWHYPQLDSTCYNHVVGPNADVPDCAITWYSAPIANYDRLGHIPGIHKASSRHPGGVNLLSMDGAVRFVAESVDLSVWRALGTRSGGDDARGI